MKFKKIQSKLLENHPMPSSRERREDLIRAMKENEANGFDCMKCTGKCCTFQANSMNMTNLEALDALVYLEENNLINDDLIEQLESCVDEYRLNNSIQIGRNDFFRKAYTCPFFNYKGWGCRLGIENKPYGCLAFNPRTKEQEDGGNCNSDIKIQQQRLDKFEEVEEAASQYLSKQFGVFELKSSIPVKLLEFLHSDVEIV